MFEGDIRIPNSQQTGVPVPARQPFLPAVEWRTLLLILATYGGWLTATKHYGRWPLAALVPAITLLLTLHSSLQHEMAHGHPTRWPLFNRLLASVPLSLWLPFPRYLQTHLVHHQDDRLTDPIDDPESYYLTPEDFARLSPLSRGMLQIQRTLAGRMLLGPPWIIGKFLRAELRAVWHGEAGMRAVWLEHLLWCVPVVYWVQHVCGMPFWLYVVTMVMPSAAVILIRSFAEHRARPAVRQRVAIVENSWILGPLFLFNNLHALHHEKPSIPWYRYNARYRRERSRLIAYNGGLVYNSYFDVARRFLFRPHDTLQHPMGRVPASQVSGR
jgi:fatty acid desaturase